MTAVCAHIATIRPGPVLHIWRDGVEVFRLPLTRSAALALIGTLASALMEPQR